MARFQHVVSDSASYLGTTQYPSEYSQIAEDPTIEYLRQDPDYDKLLSSMGATMSQVPYELDADYVGVDSTVFQPIFSGEDMQKQAEYTAAHLTPGNIEEAAFHHNTFGQGYINTYKSDMPQQGINLLREPIAPEIQDPCHVTEMMGIPPRGPFAGFTPGAHQFIDPRYNVPQFQLGSEEVGQSNNRIRQYDMANFSGNFLDVPDYGHGVPKAPGITIRD